MKTCATTAAVLVSALVSSASADVVMDFQDLEIHDNGLHDWGYVYTVGNWMLSHPETEPYQFASAGTLNDLFYQGSTGLFNNTVDGVTTFERVDGAAFDMESIDIANLARGGSPVTVNFVGHLQGGGEVHASFQVSSSFDFETFSFAGLGFEGVTSVVWVQQAPFHQFDNIAIVPAPGAIALLGLAGLRRRRA